MFFVGWSSRFLRADGIASEKNIFLMRWPPLVSESYAFQVNKLTVNLHLIALPGIIYDWEINNKKNYKKVSG